MMDEKLVSISKPVSQAHNSQDNMSDHFNDPTASLFVWLFMMDHHHHCWWWKLGWLLIIIMAPLLHLSLHYLHSPPVNASSFDLLIILNDHC